jgi:hypothetical protein
MGDRAVTFKAEERTLTFTKDNNSCVETTSSSQAGSSASSGSPDPLIVYMGQNPPSKLLVNVVSHAKVIARLNERIFSGLVVGREYWDDTKASVDDLARLLDHVEYRERLEV